MADIRFSDNPLITAIQDTDIFPGSSDPDGSDTDVKITFLKVATWIEGRTFANLDANHLNAPSVGNTPNSTAITTSTTGGAAGTEMSITYKGTHYWGGDISSAFASLDANLLDPGTAQISFNSPTIANFILNVDGLVQTTDGVYCASGTLNLSADNSQISFDNCNLVNSASITTGYAYVGGLEGNDPSNSLVISTTTPGGTINLNHNFLIGTLLRMNSNSYSTGTMSQSGNIITGVGTTWTFDMAGGSITTAGGITSMVLEVAGNNTLIVDRNMTIPSTSYELYYDGIQSAEVTGALGVTHLVANTSVMTPIITTNGVDLTISPSTSSVNFSNSNITNIYDATFTSLINTPMINTLSGELSIFASNGIVNLINPVNLGVSDLISEYMHAGVEVIAQASDYTLSANDLNTHQTCSKSSAQTITIPANATVAAPIGTWVSFSWSGVGQPSFTPAGGVTLNSQLGNRKIAAQYCSAVAIKVSINTWELYGALTA